MNASKITITYIGPHFMTMGLHTLYTPDLVRLMAHWVYTNHNDFLEEYYDFFDEDGEWSQDPAAREKMKALYAKRAKLAKEFKKVFPHVKQQNVMYENIMEILKEIILDENA